MDEHLPIIAGVGQVTQRPDTEHPREPLSLMAEAARLAAADAGSPGLLNKLDSVRVINIISWPSKSPAHDLANALGATPAEALYTHVGGNSPQWQVNEAAARIHAGELRRVLIAGAEAVYSARRARARGIDLGWSPRGTPAPDTGDPRPGITPFEAKHGATLPVHVYPMFENALRAHYGRALEGHQQEIGRLFASFSAVAAANPHAWFRTARTAEEIVTPDPDNRYIGFPYTKFMNSILDVDQGAALLLTSAGEARRLGIPEDRWVYLRGCGDATDHWFVSERVNYHSSPAMRLAGRRALDMAGLSIDAIDCFDLYSCFPSAVQIARDMLGVQEDDPRPLTVTGGLPYFGGPGNNYVSHSIASMVEWLRAHPGKNGMVTANGWYVTKHAMGIYSTEPPREPWRRTAPAIDQAVIDAEPRPPFVEEPSGAAIVETYTVLFNRDGAPERGIIIGRIGDAVRADAPRFIANTRADRATLESMTRREMVGTRGSVRPGAGDGTNTFIPG